MRATNCPKSCWDAVASKTDDLESERLKRDFENTFKNHPEGSINVRVFSVFFHPNPSWSALGGAEKRFVETLKNFDAESVKMTVVESKPSLLTKLRTRYQIYELPSFVSASNSTSGCLGMYVEWILWTLRACIKCPSIIRRKGYEIVFAPNNTVPNLIPAYITSRICHLPLCVTVHHIDLPSPNVNLTLPRVYRTYRKTGFSRPVSLIKSLASFIILTVLRRSDACIAVSSSTANALTRNGVPEKKIYISGNGVDINYIDSFQLNSDEPYDGVFVGRISKEKGVFDLVMAWQGVIRVKSEARLLIIGNGLDIGEVRRVVKELSLEGNIIVKGPCSNRDMYTLMKASRVFVFPSRFEGWGLAVAEALACGLPVVCYDIPALREVFSGCRSVFLVPVGNIEVLASTILRLLSLSEAEDLAKASKTYVKPFSWKEVAERDLQIITLACGGNEHSERDTGKKVYRVR